MPKQIVLAGATGYLGRYIAQALVEAGYPTTLIVRHRAQAHFDPERFTLVEAQVTEPETLLGVLEGADVVISTVGITRQRDGLTYMDVDYQANANLLAEAQRAGVRQFIYTAVFNGEHLRAVKLCAAKERFVTELKASGLDYCIVRPTGYFSDMRDFLDMAQAGRVFLFGDGQHRLNPIHGADLAQVFIEALDSQEHEIAVGGPDVFTQNDLAALALSTLGKERRIVHLPDGLRRFVIWFLRRFTPLRFYGPLEFFLTALAVEMVAPQRGTHHLQDFFEASKGNG